MLTLHARTADQLYCPPAHWDAIGELVHAVPGMPVIANGDVYEAADALRVMRNTGCAGDMVGRGCLGRPWLFSDLESMFQGQHPPCLGEVFNLATGHVPVQGSWSAEGAWDDRGCSVIWNRCSRDNIRSARLALGKS
eukprot:gene20935-27784_t